MSSDFIANKNGWLYSSAIGRWIVLINGVKVKSGGRIAYYAHGGVKPNEYIHTPDPSPTAHFYVKKGDIVISYGSADSNLKGNPHGTIYGNYKFSPLRKK